MAIVSNLFEVERIRINKVLKEINDEYLIVKIKGSDVLEILATVFEQYKDLITAYSVFEKLAVDLCVYKRVKPSEIPQLIQNLCMLNALRNNKKLSPTVLDQPMPLLNMNTDEVNWDIARAIRRLKTNKAKKGKINRRLRDELLKLCEAGSVFMFQKDKYMQLKECEVKAKSIYHRVLTFRTKIEEEVARLQFFLNEMTQLDKKHELALEALNNATSINQLEEIIIPTTKINVSSSEIEVTQLTEDWNKCNLTHEFLQVLNPFLNDVVLQWDVAEFSVEFKEEVVKSINEMNYTY